MYCMYSVKEAALGLRQLGLRFLAHSNSLNVIGKPKNCEADAQEYWASRPLTRTVARKFSIGGFAFLRGVALGLCGGGWYSKNWQKLNWFIVFHVSIWGGLELCLGGLSPQKHPRGNGTHSDNALAQSSRDQVSGRDGGTCPMSPQRLHKNTISFARPNILW